ncbi:hypothetical protein [Kalamiella sp. sgz302252]|uniref:hypothetical protein n=1 Tax=Pantoea sp. sgz302252 TaxID=3341827 RepID=UPI0036D20DA6
MTIGSYFHTGSQHNYGYYSGWGIGEFKLTSTDIFDPETVAVKTCCGYDKSIYNKKNGFLFQIAQDNTSKLIKFLQNNPAAPLTVFIGNNQYKLGRYTGLSNRNNYFWEDGEVQQLLDNCFNKNNINKSYPIILQFEIDNLSV